MSEQEVKHSVLGEIESKFQPLTQNWHCFLSSMPELYFPVIMLFIHPSIKHILSTNMYWALEIQCWMRISRRTPLPLNKIFTLLKVTVWMNVSAGIGLPVTWKVVKVLPYRLWLREICNEGIVHHWKGEEERKCSNKWVKRLINGRWSGLLPVFTCFTIFPRVSVFY